eukprot:2182180-Prymnesium_polylepis.2
MGNSVGARRGPTRLSVDPVLDVGVQLVLRRRRHRLARGLVHLAVDDGREHLPARAAAVGVGGRRWRGGVGVWRAHAAQRERERERELRGRVIPRSWMGSGSVAHHGHLAVRA